MLRIRVIHIDGHAPATPIAHDFDRCSGTIGRDDSNALVLPDPERHISRMQAQVEYDGTSYLLIDHGGNPTLHNGHPLGKGVSVSLRDGDEIGIAEYTLRVEILGLAPQLGRQAVPAHNPVADPLGLFAPAPPVAAARAAPTPQAPTPTGSGAHDDDPFAVFIPPAAAVPTPPPGPAPATRAPVGDDPFAAFVPASSARPAAGPSAPDSNPLADPLGIGALAQPAEASSLDALFGLEQGGRGHDPFAGSALGDPAFAPKPPAPGADDPLALLGGGARPSAPAAVRDDSPLLRDAYTPPRLVDDGPAEAAPPKAPRMPPTAPHGGVVSWATPDPTTGATPDATSGGAQAEQQAPRESQTRIVPPPPAGAPPRTETAAKVNVGASPPPFAAPTSAPSPAPAPAPLASAPQTAADSDALLSAFARGIGLPALTPAAGMTPEFMEHIGRMLRESVQGTVELLIARAATKREVRADVTMIVSRNNNPLKFSPDVNFALQQLLTPQGSGFMGPEEAMRDAYDDLRAHQIGFIAGMRAALASVLARFTPAELESRLTTKSLLDSVLPANRKAKLWDLYEQRYGEISREAEDDFHSLFGREFLKAYDAQIERLQRDRN